MAIEIKLADAPLGHEIRGVDLANISDADFAELEAAFDRYGVVVLRDQKITPEQHVAFSRRFGELDRYVFDRFNLPGIPWIFVVSNIIENGRPIGMADAGRYWHSDMWVSERPPRGSIMHGIEIPMGEDGEALGDTLFASTQAAYDALPAPLKRRIAGRKAVYSGAGYARYRRGSTAAAPDGAAVAAEARDTLNDVEQIHPLVRIHPRTGRNCIYFSEGAIREVSGLTAEETGALLLELQQHIVRPEFIYRHKWRPGDIVLWDNCSAIHRATSDYAAPLRRHMHRTTLTGTTPIMGSLPES